MTNEAKKENLLKAESCSIALTEIKVGNRIRTSLSEIEDLAANMRQFGLLQPIVIDTERRLIVGERRYRAAELLEWEKIDVRIVDLTKSRTPKTTQLLYEFIENDQRTALTWADEVRGVQTVHKSLRARFEGRKDVEWTIVNTAQLLGFGKSYISEALVLAEGLETCPEIMVEPSRRKAMGRLKHLTERVLSAEKARRLAEDDVSSSSISEAITKFAKLPKEKQTALWDKAESQLEKAEGRTFNNNHRIIRGDCIEELAKLSEAGFKASLILTDPQYGIGYHGKGATHTTFNDSRKALEVVVEAIRLFPLVLRDESFVILFCDYEFAFDNKTILRQELNRFAECARASLVWIKPTLSKGDFSKWPSGNYEFALFARKGAKVIISPMQATFECMAPTGSSRSHETEKPVALLQYYIEHLTYPGEYVLDPFAGSCSTLEAAGKLDRSCVCIEQDKTYCERGLLRSRNAGIERISIRGLAKEEVGQ